VHVEERGEFVRRISATLACNFCNSSATAFRATRTRSISVSTSSGLMK
jgi:hypothetical protein